MNSLAGGSAVEDFDGDGWLDVLTTTCDPAGSMRYFRNLGDGRFADRTEAAGLAEQLGGLNLVTGDVVDPTVGPQAGQVAPGWGFPGTQSATAEVTRLGPRRIAS